MQACHRPHPAQLRQIKAGNFCILITKMVYGLERYREADLGLLRERRNKHRASGSPTALLPAAAVSGGVVPVMEIARSYGVSHSTISRLA